MVDHHDTFQRRIQLGASRRRFEDAESLYEADRWSGCIYLGGYAIECSLKALICYNECKENFKDTSLGDMPGNALHSLTKLLSALPAVQRAIALDRSGEYESAWNMVSCLWKKDQLRYSDKVGNQNDSEQFIDAVRMLHTFLLLQQGEIS